MPQPHNSKLNRRHFIRNASLVTGAILFGVPTLLRARNLNSKLNIAAIGAGGKGINDTDCCSGENILALCDVDSKSCAGQLKKYPNAKYFRDYRKMLDELGKSIDAVTVSTPDHFHAIAASHAMQMGKHVYCQKPLTQTIHEARYLRELARSTGVITQMGNQGSASDGLRRAVECIQSGLIGQVREVHVWTDRPIWPQGIGRPEGSDPVPENLDWDIWLGPAPMRPFKENAYHTFNWRGWLDFGTGALGDMACHTTNMAFRALRLGHPTAVESESFGMNSETYPIGSKIVFHFPERPVPAKREGSAQLLPAPALAALKFHWYDGGKPLADKPHKHDGSNKPPKEITADIETLLGEVPGAGCLLIGDRGQVFSPDDYNAEFYVKLNGEKKFTHFKKHGGLLHIPQTIARNRFSGDNDKRHKLEWINAIKEENPRLCYSRFEIGAQLTEIMLLGCVSLRVGKRIEWDGANMRALNCPEAAPFIKRDNRPGWKLA